MLWIKAFHIVFVICWFAGIFYLPRLYVHHAMSEDPATRERLKIMERKLYRFMTPLGVIAIVLGLWLILLNPDFYMQSGWMHVKLFCVVLLIIYHGFCGYYMRCFRNDRIPHSHIYFRWFNEFPVLLLIIIVIMVVIRPF